MLFPLALQTTFNTFIQRSSTYCVCWEGSKHHGGEAFIERADPLLPDQLPQHVTHAVGVHPFSSCGGKRFDRVEVDRCTRYTLCPGCDESTLADLPVW